MPPRTQGRVIAQRNQQSGRVKFRYDELSEVEFFDAKISFGNRTLNEYLGKAMATKLKMNELKEQLEVAGWELINSSEMFSAIDDTIEWHLLNRKHSNSENLTFYLFDDLGQRTDKLSDIFYVMRSKDSLRLYFDKKDKNWKRNLTEFVYTIM